MLSLGPLAFAAPWLLVALAALPVLWWLLRVTPPTPRRVAFPAVRLLHDLPVSEETPSRTPWWLLLLRMLAAALVILGLARPVLGPGAGVGGEGPLLLVVDDGWAAAADWPARMAAAAAALDRAGREGRGAALLATAPGETGEGPRVIGPMPASDLRTRLAALRPKPWAPDHAAALAALDAWRAANPGSLASLAVSDGVEHAAEGAASGALQAALAAAGPLTLARVRAAGAAPAAARRRGRPAAPAGAATAATRRRPRRWCWRAPAMAGPWPAPPCRCPKAPPRRRRSWNCRSRSATRWSGWSWKARRARAACCCWTSASAAAPWASCPASKRARTRR